MTYDQTANDQRATDQTVETYEAPRLTDEGSIADLTGVVSCFPSVTGGYDSVLE
ncbi:MAG: hypothetical protein ACYCTE_11485 [Acidimicrobiales bacterium]